MTKCFYHKRLSPLYGVICLPLWKICHFLSFVNLAALFFWSDFLNCAAEFFSAFLKSLTNSPATNIRGGQRVSQCFLFQRATKSGRPQEPPSPEPGFLVGSADRERRINRVVQLVDADYKITRENSALPRPGRWGRCSAPREIPCLLIASSFVD